MNNSFTYSVLQYRHSLVLGEAINVGILFEFPSSEKLEFVSGNAQRLKAIYPDFDPTVYNYLIKSIERKLKEEGETLFHHHNFKTDFKRYLHSAILPEDATVLQFQDPVSVLADKGETYEVRSIGDTVEVFSNLLLPGIITKKPEVVRHNENFLIKRFTGYLLPHPGLEKRIKRNTVIKTNVNKSEIELKFDFSWENGSTNFIKPVSFDLTEERAILDKSLVNYGYLNLLGDYAKDNNYRFDFFISKPHDRKLYKSYDNAIGLLNQAEAPKRLITEEDLKDYSEEAIESLSKL
jgi:hypothetical protein